jgi:PhzF family phenazine biosynthesis protein
MMKPTIYQVDAFTEIPFKGNPAGVMFLEAFPSETWMQNMAAEMNVSETAFVVADAMHYEIKYFSPTMEIPLCGHATLATAHVMYEQGIVALDEDITFNAKGGVLKITYTEGALEMALPRNEFSEIEIPENFEAILGFAPVATYEAQGWVIAVANNEAHIEACVPDFTAFKANGLDKLMITAEATVASKADFVVRCFAPIAGIDEDPVTGSAHCALTPLWAERLGKTKLISHQISKRGGILEVTLEAHTVLIKGKALTVFEAQLNIEVP